MFSHLASLIFLLRLPVVVVIVVSELPFFRGILRVDTMEKGFAMSTFPLWFPLLLVIFAFQQFVLIMATSDNQVIAMRLRNEERDRFGGGSWNGGSSGWNEGKSGQDFI